MFKVGPVIFHLYGLMIGLGVLVGSWAASKKYREVWDGLLWAVGGGIIGARLYHVIDYWSYYSQNLTKIIAVWQGGMGIFGGILGGALGLLIFSQSKKKWLKLLDAGALGLPLGQAIGRWGNFFNQELYGYPSTLPWAIYIKPENRLVQFMDYKYFQPLFLYESLWCLSVFIILWRLSRRWPLGQGKWLAAYLFLYGLGRFFLEFLRLNPWQIGGINVGQAISLGLMAGAGWYLWKKSV
ncbi:MAG: prolipoprotein diacylglyceryl transferase [Candidatus Beckwithbacteria bacterium]